MIKSRKEGEENKNGGITKKVLKTKNKDQSMKTYL